MKTRFLSVAAIGVWLVFAGCTTSPQSESPLSTSEPQERTGARSITPTPVPTPAHPRPWERAFAAPEEVLASGEAVPFKVCSRTTGWRKPTLEEMQPVFTNKRFGDGIRPRPFDYVLYLSRYYYVSTPTANSANTDVNAFSGFYLHSSPSGLSYDLRCDYASLYAEAAATVSAGGPGKGVGLPFQSFRLADHHMVDMKRKGDQMVVLAESSPDSWEDVIFPFPPTAGFFDTPTGLSAIDVVSDSGALLYRWRREAYVEWYEDWQYEDDGRLRYLELAGAPPLFSTTIDVPVSASLTLFPGSMRPPNPPNQPEFPAGNIVIRDAGGRVVSRQAWRPRDDEWQPLARLALGAGSYTITIEVPGDSPVGPSGHPYRHFVLIRDDIALP